MRHRPSFKKQFKHNPWKYQKTRETTQNKRVHIAIIVVIAIVIFLLAYKFYLPHALSDIGDTKRVGELDVTLIEVYKTDSGVTVELAIYNPDVWKKKIDHDLFVLNNQTPIDSNLSIEVYMYKTINGTLEYSISDKKYELESKGVIYRWSSWQMRNL